MKYRASVLSMFNVYEFCCFNFNNLLRKTCTADFLFNEAVSFLNYPV